MNEEMTDTVWHVLTTVALCFGIGNAARNLMTVHAVSDVLERVSVLSVSHENLRRLVLQRVWKGATENTTGETKDE